MSWQLKEEMHLPVVALEWRESGVPINHPPKRKGYGSELIERALPYQLNAKTRLEFGPDGVRCDVLVPISAEVPHG